VATVIKKTLVLKKCDSCEFKNLYGMLKLEQLNQRLLGVLFLGGENLDIDKLTLVISDGCGRFERFTFIKGGETRFECHGISIESFYAVIFYNHRDSIALLHTYSSKSKFNVNEFYSYEKNYALQRESHEKTQQTNLSHAQSDRSKANFSGDKAEREENLAIPYDDEAIATENYFERENIDELKKSTVGTDYECISEQIATTSEPTQQSAEKMQEECRFEQNQARFDNFACEIQLPTFYKSVEDKILKLFKEHAEFSALCEVIPNSKWIKIEYGANSHYVVGMVYKNNIPVYIVYGVPGNRHNRPTGFSNYPCFVPASLYENTDAGYWCTFQDTMDGKVIAPESEN